VDFGARKTTASFLPVLSDLIDASRPDEERLARPLGRDTWVKTPNRDLREILARRVLAHLEAGALVASMHHRQFPVPMVPQRA